MFVPWSESQKRGGPGGATSLGRRRVSLIEGHTDGPEDSVSSRGVGEERAKSAEDYLVSEGAVADRFTIVSRDGGRPACREKTAICRAANRRATFSAAVRP